MKTQITLLICLVMALSNQLFAQKRIEPVKKEPLIIGERIEIESEILEQTRVLNIYLPNGYSPDSLKTYPVIYLLDGSIHEDFLHIAGLVQFSSYPWLEKMPECIVVGISNINRYHDFTYPSEKEEYQEINPLNGGSAKFIDFLELEVKPQVNKLYKASETSTIIGQSLGGLIATEILFKKPNLFENYIIVSPSLWWDDESLLQMQPTKYTTQKNIFIAVGKEGKIMKSVAKKLNKKLLKEKESNTNINFQYFPELDHGDALHLAVYEAFDKIFSTK
ncbi:alpha/beta hydrolase-fold protein [Flammeovirgaceae bacterium SG7u.111]|nr:alpha/beta hydrolase-fold protein [Flammeovirgaceae bacterium SG7u.132]WPO37913.1 alpha/beta hydrolase-fold protein [Flammeovirgaceae bacterium SG7u.111]